MRKVRKELTLPDVAAKAWLAARRRLVADERLQSVLGVRSLRSDGVLVKEWAQVVFSVYETAELQSDENREQIEFCFLTIPRSLMSGLVAVSETLTSGELSAATEDCCAALTYEAMPTTLIRSAAEGLTQANQAAGITAPLPLTQTELTETATQIMLLHGYETMTDGTVWKR